MKRHSASTCPMMRPTMDPPPNCPKANVQEEIPAIEGKVYIPGEENPHPYFAPEILKKNIKPTWMFWLARLFGTRVKTSGEWMGYRCVFWRGRLWFYGLYVKEK